MPVRMTMFATAFTLLAALTLEGFAQGPSDPGLAGKAGQTLDELGRGIKSEVRQVGQGIKAEARQVSDGVARKFEGVRSEVHKMPTHHRVYSRLHWDKALHDTKVEVHMLRDGVVVLKGNVPTEAVRKHAVDLARETVDVLDVIDDLIVPSTLGAPKSAIAPKAGTSR